MDGSRWAISLGHHPFPRIPDSILRGTAGSDCVLGFVPEPLSRPIVVWLAGLLPQGVGVNLNQAETLLVAILRVGGSGVLCGPLSCPSGVHLGHVIVMRGMRRLRRHFDLRLSNDALERLATALVALPISTRTRHAKHRCRSIR